MSRTQIKSTAYGGWLFRSYDGSQSIQNCTTGCSDAATAGSSSIERIGSKRYLIIVTTEFARTVEMIHACACRSYRTVEVSVRVGYDSKSETKEELDSNTCVGGPPVAKSAVNRSCHLLREF